MEEPTEHITISIDEDRMDLAKAREILKELKKEKKVLSFHTVTKTTLDVICTEKAKEEIIKRLFVKEIEPSTQVDPAKITVVS